MTMATVAYKQGAILERFWTALRLRRSKGTRETNNLTKKNKTCKICPVGGCIKNKYFLPRSANLKKSVPTFFVKNDVPSGYYSRGKLGTINSQCRVIIRVEP
jgi:hypothetical protein